MSRWTYINGEVKVSPMGRTLEEQEYILKTVLNHLPIVTGSETSMRVDIVRLGHTCNSSHDELGNNYSRPNLEGEWERYFWHKSNYAFKLVLTSALRDTSLGEIYKLFWKWLVRLSKRVYVDYILVDINDYCNHRIIHYPDGLHDLFETPTWANEKKNIEDVEPNWCEYLMWDRDNYSMLPVEYIYKYYNDKEVDEEMIRRLRFNKESRDRFKNK